MLHFFKSTRIFTKHPEEHERFKYECEIRNEFLTSPLTDKCDLYKHLNRHEEYKKCHEKYSMTSNKRSGPVIDDATITFIKYFVTSNASHSSLENKYLKLLLNKVVGTKSFDDQILPEVYKKLEDAEDFIPLAAALVNENFKHEV